jgi:hypothetical protein
MDPALGGALIGAAGNLLGGLFGKKTSAGKNFRSHINGLMAAAAQHKLNPLTLLGVPPIGPSDGGNYMGQAIADASLLLADGISANGETEKLRQENMDLHAQVRDLTIRPKVGGVYAQREAVPTMRQALGVADGNGRAADGASDSGGVSGYSAAALSYGLDPLLESHPFDPRRPVDNDPVKSHSGFVTIDNPATGRMWIPTLDGDEALSLGEYPTALWAWATRERGIGARVGRAAKDSWDTFRLGPPAPNALLDGVTRYGEKALRYEAQKKDRAEGKGSFAPWKEDFPQSYRERFPWLFKGRANWAD